MTIMNDGASEIASYHIPNKQTLYWFFTTDKEQHVINKTLEQVAFLSWRHVTPFTGKELEKKRKEKMDKYGRDNRREDILNTHGFFFGNLHAMMYVKTSDWRKRR